jgi:regulatory protein
MDSFPKKRKILSLSNKTVSVSLSFFTAHSQNTEKLVYEKILENSLKEAAQILYRFLKTRPRSSFECEKRLYKEGFLAYEVESVIESFKVQNFLNDLTFATYFVESLQSQRPLGEFALKHKLKEKGISPTIIEEVLKPYLENDEMMIESAHLLICKNHYRFEKYSSQEKYDKIFQYLFSRGFSKRIIEITLKEILRNN